MSQNSKWSSWQQLKPTKQETITIVAPANTSSLIIEEVTPVDEPINESATTEEEVAPKPAKKRNVNV